MSDRAIEDRPGSRIRPEAASSRICSRVKSRISATSSPSAWAVWTLVTRAR
jgi:hypothetical protein